MPRVSTAHCPIPGTTILSTVKQMSSFRTGCTSGQITNSRKTIHWYYTGFRKGGRLFPIPLATVLKSACMTLENKQDIMSVELLFPRQLIPPQPDGITAGEAAQPSSDLKKLHHPFHWTWASKRLLQPSPICPPRQWLQRCRSQPHCWASQIHYWPQTKHWDPTHLQRAQTGKPGSPLQVDRASAEQHTAASQLELPPSLTTETQVWDSHPNQVQKQSAGFHRSQSFEARPRTCTSEQIKTCAAGTLRSNPFLQQSHCFGGNAAAPTASGLPQPAPGETPVPKHHWVQTAATVRECNNKKKKKQHNPEKSGLSHMGWKEVLTLCQ